MVYQPLNLEELLVNNFAGSAEILFFIIALVVAFLCAKFRVPNSVYAVLLVLFVVIGGAYYNMYLALSLFLLGFIIWLIIGRQ